jgi:hypothetical protein
MVVSVGKNDPTPLLLSPFAGAPLPALLFEEEPQRERDQFRHRPFAKRVGTRCAIGDAQNFGTGDSAQTKGFEGGAIVMLSHALQNGHRRPGRYCPFGVMARADKSLAEADNITDGLERRAMSKQQHALSPIMAPDVSQAWIAYRLTTSIPRRFRAIARRFSGA